MAKYEYPTAITANGDYKIADVHRRRGADAYLASVYAYGTWDGAAVAWKISLDGGTTKIPIYDLTSVAVTQDADKMVNINLGNGHKNSDQPQIYATVSGVGTTSLKIGLLDNN